MRHAGFCERHLGVDFDVSGLDVLCNPEFLRAHRLFRTPDETRGDAVMSRLADSLAVIAVPFLKERAIQASEDARMRGDVLAAEAYLNRAEEMWQCAEELRELAHLYGTDESRQTDGENVRRRDIKLIWRLWTADNVSGWHKLGMLRDILIEEVEKRGAECAGLRAGERLSINDQIRYLSSTVPGAVAGPFRRTEAWARAVRAAVLVALVVRIPLRAANIVGLTLDEWRTVISGPMKWAGASFMEISAEKTKSERVFSPPYLLARDVDDPDVLRMARPDLLQLYFMSGGARELLLTVSPARLATDRSSATVVASNVVFPATVSRVFRRNKSVEDLPEAVEWGDHAMSEHFKGLLKKHAHTLNLDFHALSQIQGGASIHVVRHLFGSHHCDPVRWGADETIGPVQASKMLHHASVEFTMKRYCGISEHDVSIRSKGNQQSAADVQPKTSLREIYVDALKTLLNRYVQGEIDDAAFAAQQERLHQLIETQSASASAAA
jgi:hypothetical protein